MSALFDSILSNSVGVTLAPTGEPRDSIPQEGDLFVNSRALCSQEAVDRFCQVCEEESVAERVRGIDVSGARLSDAMVASLLAGAVARMRNIQELNLSYISLGHKAVPVLCGMINVKISGYCSLKRLYLSRTGLDLKNCKAVLAACQSNIVLEQLVLSGNRYLRTAADAIETVLEDPENRFVSINLGNCGLDCSGLKSFCPTLGRHLFLRELQLNSNSFGDDGAEVLFSCLVMGGSSLVENVSLDRCNIVTCKWAQHLPDLHRIHTLTLSYNNIADVGLQELCRCVEKCFNLRSLALASNAFGEKAMCLGSLLQANPGILNLNLSGNLLLAESVEAIAFGVLQNSTMLHLNLSACVLSSENAMKICKSLLSNDLIAIDLSQNPVDAAIQADARRYVLSNQQLFDTNDMGPVEPKDYNRLSFDALARHEIWRAEQCRVFSEVKLAAQIVNEVMGKETQAVSEDGGDGATVEDTPEVDSSNGRPGTADLLAESSEILSQGGGTPVRGAAATATTPQRAGTAALDRSEPAVGESGPRSAVGRRRKKEMKEEEGTVITVSYGPRTEVLGTIRVPDSASYANVRLLVRPLVASYYERLKKSAEDMNPDEPLFEDERDMTDAFKMVDPYDIVVDREAEGSRVVLSELYGSPHPTGIVVRPITWLKLPDTVEEEEEADGFY